MARIMRSCVQQWRAAPRAMVGALFTLIAGVSFAMIRMHHHADLAEIAIILLATNSGAQAFVDFFPTGSKAKFSALARLIPILVAIIAYMVR